MTRSTILLVTGVCLALAIGWFAWRLGNSDATGDPMPRSFRVHGSSMVPTLLGAFDEATCGTCRLVWLIEPSESRSGVKELACAHCGQPMRVQSGPDIEATGKAAAGEKAGFDSVTIETMTEINESGRHLAPGDLVAVHWDGQLHLKRVAAKPGDIVSLRESRLLVNGVRIEDSLDRVACQFTVPWMLVDDDSRRQESRWDPDQATGDRGHAWTRTGRGQWSLASDQLGSWLVYGNRSPRHGNLPAPVWDDYPFNVSIVRKLFEVDRLRVRGRTISAFDCEFAFWSSEGSVVARRSLEAGQEFCISFYDGVATDGLPVRPEQPVAIRAVGGTAELTDLVIERRVEYRLRPHDERGNYPLQLSQDQWFLVGDNVPVSTDSRQWGPISRTQIIGRVQRSDPPDRRVVIPMP